MALHQHTPAQRRKVRGKSAAARAKAPGQRKRAVSGITSRRPTVSGTTSRTSELKDISVGEARRKAAKLGPHAVKSVQGIIKRHGLKSGKKPTAATSTSGTFGVVTPGKKQTQAKKKVLKGVKPPPNAGPRRTTKSVKGQGQRGTKRFDQAVKKRLKRRA